jgi:hypothetical protein
MYNNMILYYVIYNRNREKIKEEKKEIKEKSLTRLKKGAIIKIYQWRAYHI